MCGCSSSESSTFPYETIEIEADGTYESNYYYEDADGYAIEIYDEETYDLSNFNYITEEDSLLSLFESDSIEVVWFCDGSDEHCTNMYSDIVTLQEEFGYTTNYVFTGSFEYERFFPNFIALLDVVTTIDDEYTGTITSLIGDGWSGPLFIIIKDGASVDGFFGEKSYEEMKEIISKYVEE